MCLAVPGKLIEIQENYGVIDINGITMRVDIRMVHAKLGDYLLIHAGCAIQVVKQDEAEELMRFLHDLEEVLDDDYERNHTKTIS